MGRVWSSVPTDEMIIISLIMSLIKGTLTLMLLIVAFSSRYYRPSCEGESYLKHRQLDQHCRSDQHSRPTSTTAPNIR